MVFQIRCANPIPLQAPDTAASVSKLGIEPDYIIARDREGVVLSRFKDSTWDLRVYGALSTFNHNTWWDVKARGPMDALAETLTEEIKTISWFSIFETTANAGRSRGISYMTQVIGILRAIAKIAHGLDISLAEAENCAQFQVSKGSPINKDQVALEAGRKRGTIRNRPGFEKLIAEIELATGEQSRPIKKKCTQNNPNQSAEIDQLKRDLDVARSRYMSLLYLNAEMAKVIRKLGGDVPQYGTVMDLQVDPNSTDIPY